MKKFLRRVMLAAPIAAAGLILGLTLPSSGVAGSLRSLPRPERELVQAQRLASFPLRLPAWLPSGAALDRVSWPDDAALGARRSATAVDVWYRLPNGTRLHVWQTNGSALEKNPVGYGEAIRIAGATWWRERVALGTALTRHLPEGITVQITGRIADALIERIAASFGG
jgi:hypothetical protein